MKKRFFAHLLCVLSLILAFESCSKKSGITESTGSSASFAAKSMQLYDSDSTVFLDSDDFVDTSSALPLERKLIRTGSISAEVESLAQTREAVGKMAEELGGYIESSGESSSYADFTLRIPSKNFDRAMEWGESIGKIRSKNINARDVTEQFYDLDTRLKTRHVMLERLEEYLAQAKDMSDLIELEDKINEVTSELEVMQGQMNRLSLQIEYSEIQIHARLPLNRTESGFVKPDVKGSLRNFAENTLNFFANFFVGILYVVVFGIPLVLAFLLLYWICFGKIGLIRRLFAKVRAPSRRRSKLGKQTEI